MNKYVFGFMLLFGILISSTPVFSEDASVAQPAEATEPETEFSFGTVKSIAQNQIVVSEYDYESNTDVNVTYEVPADAEFENVKSLGEIAVGDSVDIDFLAKEGKKVAVVITVEKPTEVQDETAAEQDQQAPDEAKE